MRRLGLRALERTAFPAYDGDGAILVVTGTGPLKAAAGTGWAMARFPGIRQAVNIGFAGADPGVAQLHRWVYVNAIRDQASGHLLLPDILRKHPFPEMCLMTVSRIIREPLDWPGLVDMEGSGFFEAARRFVGPDRIALLKWVSDPLTGRIEPSATEEAFTRDLEPVVDFIGNWRETGPRPSSMPVESLAGEIKDRLRLTRTQTEFLRKWIPGYLARGGDPERIRDVLPETKPATKDENKRVLEELKNVFKN